MPFVQIQLRRGTAAQWTAINPTLAVGEMAVESDTEQFKIGDGVTDWNTLPYGGLHGPTGATGAGATGPTGSEGPPYAGKSFTIYLDYSSATSISRVYVPPGLFTNPALASGGVFTGDVGTDLVFYGQQRVILNNTTYPIMNSFAVAGYISIGSWVPVPGGNIGNTKVYYSMTDDYSVTLNGMGLTYINGGNTSVKPTSGLLTGFLATVTLNYI